MYVQKYTMQKRQVEKPKIIAIVGATSTGKTSFAIALAKHLKGEVVSVDSRQVYRGLNLGTGKVTKKEMRGVPHHLLDVASPKRPYSAARFTKEARTAIDGILARGHVPILCGGTGFYLDMALGRMMAPDVAPNAALRATLAKKSAPQLFSVLTRLDPLRAKTIDRHNPVRLIRAIEIAKALGSVPALSDEQRYDALTIGLTLPKEVLATRIEKRLKTRLRGGMLAEAKRLKRSGLSYERMEELGLEYRYMARHLTGALTRPEMERELLREILRYAKRQTTWFKRYNNIVWMKPTDTKKAEAFAKKFISYTSRSALR